MADIVTSRVFVDGERGISAAKLNDIVGSSVIQPAFYTAKPTASSLAPADIMLAVKAGSYVQSTFQTVIDSVSAGINSDAEIWSVRLRSFNSIGNPNFEVDQRNAGSAVSNAPNAAWALDRWQNGKSASSTFLYSIGQASQVFTGGNIVIPGTSFRITRSYLSITLNTAQASLAAGDYALIRQYVEGPQLRELASDVHSLSILCQTNVTGGLKFALRLSDPTGANSLVKLCTIPSPNAPTLITLPNIPVWPNAGTFSVTSGAVGYFLDVCLACGTTFMAPAANTWQSGAFYGAPGMDNFCGKPVNSNLLIFFIQHEPGAFCSQLMDKPFSQNLDEGLRYYQKTYDPDVAVGTPGAVGQLALPQASTGLVVGPARFHKPMAKIPTLTAYHPTTGTANALLLGGTSYTVTSFSVPGKSGFMGINATSLPAVAAGAFAQVHVTADTGW